MPGQQEAVHRIAETGNRFMDQRLHNPIMHSEDGFIVEAEVVAGKLGLSLDAFWRAMKRGIVYGVVERGEGDDTGRTRLTFRYRTRSWSMTLETCRNDESNRSRSSCGGQFAGLRNARGGRRLYGLCRAH
jgi:hypothetical protein